MRPVTTLLCCVAAYRLPPQVPSPEYVRDSEIKHGRVALLAVATLAALSTVDPEPVSYLARQPVDTQLTLFALSGVAEAASSFPRLGPRFSLKRGVHPGNFVPMPLGSPWLAELEDVAGRIAMLVAFAALVSVP